MKAAFPGAQPGLPVGRGKEAARHRFADVRKELRPGHIDDLRAGKRRLHPFDDRCDVRRHARIIAEKDLRLIGKRSYHSDTLRVPDRKNAVVLQQHHRFLGKFQRELAMGGAVEVTRIEMFVRNL
jgi:hypothetical protein